jgi:predicted transcriptional regulator
VIEVPRREKYPQGKRALYVYIDVELYNKLREVALSKYDKTHGALSAIVEEALRLYLSQSPSPRGESTHAHGTRSVLQANGDKVLAEFNRVLDYIRRLRNYAEGEAVCEVSESDLIRAIQATIGIDKRTVERRLKLYQDHKLIAQEKRDHQTIYRVLIYPECKEL